MMMVLRTILLNLSIPLFLAAAAEDEPKFYIIGVSGGLQDGFRLRHRLDYHGTGNNETVRAVLLGKALIRGYKSYFDLMEKGWRQYVEPGRDVLDGGEGLIELNPNVHCTGCHEHANEHFIYVVDSRQVLPILMGEPRFLSITPDTGLVDLESDRTSPSIRDLAAKVIRDQNKSNEKQIAIPLVTSVWFQASSQIPAPPIATLEDGTQVTNYPDSLALWAGVDPNDRLAYIDAYELCLETTTTTTTTTTTGQISSCDISNHDAYRRYWRGIMAAIERVEDERNKRLGDVTTLQREQRQQQHPSSIPCKKRARFGVDDDTARVNYGFTAGELETVWGDGMLDLTAGKFSSMTSESKDNSEL